MGKRKSDCTFGIIKWIVIMLLIIIPLASYS